MAIHVQRLSSYYFSHIPDLHIGLPPVPVAVAPADLVRGAGVGAAVPAGAGGPERIVAAHVEVVAAVAPLRPLGGNDELESGVCSVRSELPRRARPQPEEPVAGRRAVGAVVRAAGVRAHGAAGCLVPRTFLCTKHCVGTSERSASEGKRARVRTNSVRGSAHGESSEDSRDASDMVDHHVQRLGVLVALLVVHVGDARVVRERRVAHRPVLRGPEPCQPVERRALFCRENLRAREV